MVEGAETALEEGGDTLSCPTTLVIGVSSLSTREALGRIIVAILKIGRYSKWLSLTLLSDS